MTEDIVGETQKFTEHSKKVYLLNFNPCVEEVIASASMDNTVNIWNIYTGQSYSKIALKDTILSLNWNQNGSLVGLTNKEKLVHVLDPRANKVILSSKAHDSSKSQKMLFLDSNHLFTCGFNRNNERQLKLFDMRNFENPVQELKVDTQTGIMLPFFDADIGLIFVPGRVKFIIIIFFFF